MPPHHMHRSLGAHTGSHWDSGRFSSKLLPIREGSSLLLERSLCSSSDDPLPASAFKIHLLPLSSRAPFRLPADSTFLPQLEGCSLGREEGGRKRGSSPDEGRQQSGGGGVQGREQWVHSYLQTKPLQGSMWTKSCSIEPIGQLP